MYVACGCTTPELDAIPPDGGLKLVYTTAIYYAQKAEISSQVASTFFNI
jgi:hypothetical protein